MSEGTRDPRVEANKATVRQMLQRLSAGDVAGFTNHLSPDYIRHSQAMPPELQEIRGRDAMHQWLLSNFVPFPDYQEALEWLVGERFRRVEVARHWHAIRSLRAIPGDGQAHRSRNHRNAPLRGSIRGRDVDVLGQSRRSHAARTFPGAKQLALAVATTARDTPRPSPRPPVRWGLTAARFNAAVNAISSAARSSPGSRRS